METLITVLIVAISASYLVWKYLLKRPGNNKTAGPCGGCSACEGHSGDRQEPITKIRGL
jgi:hypothetical protein